MHCDTGLMGDLLSFGLVPIHLENGQCYLDYDNEEVQQSPVSMCYDAIDVDTLKQDFANDCVGWDRCNLQLENFINMDY